MKTLDNGFVLLKADDQEEDIFDDEEFHIALETVVGELVARGSTGSKIDFATEDILEGTLSTFSTDLQFQYVGDLKGIVVDASLDSGEDVLRFTFLVPIELVEESLNTNSIAYIHEGQAGLLH